MRELKNSGMVFYNQNNIKNIDKKTIIVLGLPRSGTSMIGKVLYCLDVFHDAGFLNKNIYEDAEIINIFEVKKQDIGTYIKRQNNTYDIWGFKRPGAYYYINKYIHLIQNPIFIIPFKDLLSISLRKNISIDMDFEASLKESTKQLNDLVEFIDETETPSLLFSYEKAILSPETFVRTLIKMLSLQNISKEKIDLAINAITINPKEYLNSSRLQATGRVERLHRGILSGWAKFNINNKPVEVYVYDLNHICIAKGLASIYRKDLEENAVGNGAHAFAIQLDKDIQLKDIIVTAGKHNDKLKMVTAANEGN